MNEDFDDVGYDDDSLDYVDGVPESADDKVSDDDVIEAVAGLIGEEQDSSKADAIVAKGGKNPRGFGSRMIGNDKVQHVNAPKEPDPEPIRSAAVKEQQSQAQAAWTQAHQNAGAS